MSQRILLAEEHHRRAKKQLKRGKPYLLLAAADVALEVVIPLLEIKMKLISALARPIACFYLGRAEIRKLITGLVEVLYLVTWAL